MVSALSGWLADSVETGISPGLYEIERIIRGLLELDRSRNRFPQADS